MKVHGFDLHYTIGVEEHRHTKHFYLTVWTQPLRFWLAAKIYHWYDMRIPKMPGFRLVEKWHSKLLGRRRDHIPLGCLQDLRCFYLSHLGRVDVWMQEISSDVYSRIKEGVHPGR